MDGTVCDRTLRARIRTAGTAYGPFEVKLPFPTVRSAMSAYAPIR